MTSVTLSADCDLDVGSLDRLEQAIAARAEALQTTIADATVAAGITVLRSLKAATRDAGEEPSPSMFKVERLGAVAGWHNVPGGPRRRVPRMTEHGPRLRDLHPVNLMYGLSGPGEVWQITLTNPNVPWRTTRNKGRYVLMAPTAEVAVRYAQARVRNLLRKEHGMARYALAIAQARASTRSDLIPREAAQKGRIAPRPAGLAYDAAEIEISSEGFGSGVTYFNFTDHLRYSSPAAGGEAALRLAIDKASNSMLGYFREVTGQAFPIAGKDITFAARNSIPWRWN